MTKIFEIINSTAESLLSPILKKEGGVYISSYEIIPSHSPLIKKMEEYNRKLRPGLYAQFDRENQSKGF